MKNWTQYRKESRVFLLVFFFVSTNGTSADIMDYLSLPASFESASYWVPGGSKIVLLEPKPPFLDTWPTKNVHKLVVLHSDWALEKKSS